jgi:hypothetical protein
MLCGISCELAGCVHQLRLRVHDSRLRPNQTWSAIPAKLNLFKTPASGGGPEPGPGQLPEGDEELLLRALPHQERLRGVSPTARGG